MFTEFAQAIAGPSGMRHFDPPASDTPPRAGHSTALTLPHLRPRPGTLRPAPPQPRRVRHAQRDPAGSGHCQHRPRTRPAAAPPTATCGGSNTTASSFTGTTVPAGSLAAYGMGGQFRLVIPAIDRVIALLADQQRPGGSGRAVHRPALAKLVHYATDGAVPLSAVPLASDRARMMTGTVHNATAGICTD